MQCPNCGGDDIVAEEIKALCLDCEFEGSKLVFSNIPAEIVTAFVDAMMNYCVSCSEDIPPGPSMCSECHYWYTKEN